MAVRGITVTEVREKTIEGLTGLNVSQMLKLAEQGMDLKDARSIVNMRMNTLTISGKGKEHEFEVCKSIMTNLGKALDLLKSNKN